MKKLLYQLTKIRRFGLISALKDLLQSINPVTLRVHRVVKEDLVELPVDTTWDMRTGVDALRKTREGFDKLPDAFYTDLRREAHECYFIVVDNQPAAIVWSFVGHTQSRYFDLGPQDANLATLFVRDELRRRGLARLVMQYGCQELFKEGFRHVYTEIDENNMGARRTQEPIGLQKVDVFRRSLLIGPRYICEQRRPETWGEMLRKEISLGNW